MATDATVGRRIRERRLAMKLSQARLAIALGIAPSIVSRMERAPQQPHRATLERIAAALAVDMRELLGEVPASARSSLVNSETLGKRVRRRREAIGLAQAQLAAMLGIPNATMQRIERGEHQPGPGTLARIATTMGIDPTTLLEQQRDSNNDARPAG